MVDGQHFPTLSSQQHSYLQPHRPPHAFPILTSHVNVKRTSDFRLQKKKGPLLTMLSTDSGLKRPLCPLPSSCIPIPDTANLPAPTPHLKAFPSSLFPRRTPSLPLLYQWPPLIHLPFSSFS